MPSRQLAPLSAAQALAAGADAFVTVSLAGSLFFNLSPDASRQQVLLYLIVTTAPLAVLAPMIGPAVDRFRRFQRSLAATCFILRAAFCLALATTLFRLSFFGFALALLVVNKASGIVKQALVPLLVEDPSQLVTTNARLARLTGAAGAVAGGIAVGLLRLAGAPWLLRIAAVVFVAAAVSVSRVVLRPAPEPLAPEVEYAELHSPTLFVSSIGFMAIRAAVGFFVFMLAFTLRRASEPAWVYGAALVAYGIGSFAGSSVAPAMRRRLRDDQLIAVAIAAPTVPTIIGILGVSRPLLLAIASLIGASTTLGRHGFDSLLQQRAPVARRGRAAARYETGFQLAWAFGAVIATPVSLPPEASMAVLTALYLPALAVFVRSVRNARQVEQRAAPDLIGRAGQHLVAASESRAAGAPRAAVVEAAAAGDLAQLVDLMLAPHGGPATDGPATQVAGERARLQILRLAALDGAAPITVDDADVAIALAASIVSRSASASKQ
jgi:Transmembrane secretion effector